MTNQQVPPPFIPPLTPEEVEASNTRWAMHLAKLATLSFSEGFDIMSGFKSQPSKNRLAYYRQQEAVHGSLEAWLTKPNLIPTQQVDEQGMPAPPIPAPSLMELSALTCAWMLKDAGTLFAKEQESGTAIT